jgi:hypothetical protein
MADRTRYPSNSGGSIGREYIELKLKLNGAGIPIVLAGGGFLTSSTPTAHTGGTNVYTINMRDAWLELIAHAVDVRDDVPNGAYATIGTIQNEAGQASGGVVGITGTPGKPLTFKVATWTAGGAVSNDSTLICVITLAFRNSNEQYGN